MATLRKIGDRELATETLMMSYGYDPSLSQGAIKPPIFQCSTFVFESAEEGKRFFAVAKGLREKEPNESIGLIYSRINNPNLEILEDRLALWDEAERALVFSSGMAAIATTVFALCKPGDTFAYTEPCYGGAHYLFDRILPRFSIEAVPVRIGQDRQSLGQELLSINERCTSSGRCLTMIYVETPANPTNELADLADVARIAKMCNPDSPPVVVVDNTFLGPVWQKPLRHGADIVLYSLTKYVGGHSDLIAGAVLGRTELLHPVAELRTIFGTPTDPHTAWLLLRSVETLKLRMECSATNARKIAVFLTEHHGVERVLFPDIRGAAAEQQEIYQRQCSGPGSTLSVLLRGGEREAFQVLNQLRLFKLAVSLGGTESLASHPSSMTHCDYSSESKLALGVTENLIRLSVGVEDADDLRADVSAALDAVYS